MIRLLHVALAASLGLAPYQCGHESDTPDLKREDSADDALYKAAAVLHDRGDPSGEKQVLKYLLEQYPRSRHAVDARARLGADLASPSDAGPSP